MLSSMENLQNYTLKDQIGKSAQATVYIAERQSDKELFTLKKVECFDESEANKAFKEATQLQNLQHPYVSGYREFFVLWEKEDSSVYICILMDYFPKGNLEQVLNKCREKKEVIDEERIKKWLGQIIEALVYVHKKKIIHRDVRPSNIYVQQDDSLVLGDFGVATIRGDAVTCTRADSSSMNYMAPEVCEGGSYIEASDVFALGCVLFELVTTWLYDREEAISKLQEIRKDPIVLDEIFEEISVHFSDSLISVLKSMLKTNSDTRPTAVGLLSNKYIRKCVELSDSTQLEKRKRIQSASTTVSDAGPVPRDQGVLRVLEYLASHIDFESCVSQALDYLLELSKTEEGLYLDPKGKKLVAMAMKNNMTDQNVQITGCNVLNSLVIAAQSDLWFRGKADDDDALFTPEVIAVIPYAMETHKDSAEVQLAGATLIMALSANGPASAVIGHLGGVHDILTALQNHNSNAQLCSTCLNALWGLSVYGNNVKIATEEGGVRVVCDVLRKQMNSSEVAEAACAGLLALSLDEENLELVSELDAVGLLVNAVRTHSKSSKVVKNACLALASLVEIDEESAYRVLTNEGPDKTHIAGVPIIINTYELHKDNAEVVESIVTLIMELAEYDEICLDLNGYRIIDQLEEVIKKFNMNKDIMGPCEKALERLRGVKRPPVKTPSPEPQVPKEA